MKKKQIILLVSASVTLILAVAVALLILSVKSKQQAYWEKNGNADFMLFCEESTSAVTVNKDDTLPSAWLKQDGVSFTGTGSEKTKTSLMLYLWAANADCKVTGITVSDLWSPEAGTMTSANYITVTPQEKLPTTVAKGAAMHFQICISWPDTMQNGVYNGVVTVYTGKNGETARQLRLRFTVTDTGAASTVTLADNGKTDWVIVETQSPTAAEKLAVSEFIKYFKQVTNVNISVKSETEPQSGKEIIIGKGLRIEADDELNSSPPGSEGIYIKISQNQIIIYGGDDRGTLYGTYSFLEDYLGCKWLSGDTTVVPETKKLIVPMTVQTEYPKFEYRAIYSKDGSIWSFALPNKINSGNLTEAQEYGGITEYAGDIEMHIENLLPVSEYYAAHPEYFAFVGGKRSNSPDAQLCLSNANVINTLIQQVRTLLEQNPLATHVSLRVNSDTSVCGCSVCQAINSAEGSKMGTLMRFANKLAGTLAAQYPTVYFEILAEGDTIAPTVTKPAYNVIVLLSNKDTCISQSYEESQAAQSAAGKKTFYDYLKVWGERTPNLYILDYTVNPCQYLLPVTNFDIFKKNVKTIASIGVSGMISVGAEDTADADFAKLNAYVASKLMWREDYPVELAVNEFLTGYYGTSYGYIYDYLNLLEASMKGQSISITSDINKNVYTKKFVQKADQLFDLAEERAARDSVLLNRVRIARLPLRYLKLRLNYDKQNAEIRTSLVEQFFDDLERYDIEAISKNSLSDDKAKLLSEVSKTQ